MMNTLICVSQRTEGMSWLTTLGTLGTMEGGHWVTYMEMVGTIYYLHVLI